MTNRKNIVNYVKNKKNSLKQQKIGDISIFIKDNITNNVKYETVFEHINFILPYKILNLIDVVYIGDFDFFEHRAINAVYMDRAIYVSNEQSNKEDMIDDIVHEVAHAVEETHKYFIYNDKLVENEFLGKRNKLELMLNHEGYNTDHLDFLNLAYEKELDLFLYDEVGNANLNKLINGLFMRGYSAVSLREYFATTFEEYYLGNNFDVKGISPFLYEKINLINEEQELNKNEF